MVYCYYVLIGCYLVPVEDLWGYYRFKLVLIIYDTSIPSKFVLLEIWSNVENSYLCGCYCIKKVSSCLKIIVVRSVWNI